MASSGRSSTAIITQTFGDLPVDASQFEHSAFICGAQILNIQVPLS